MIAGILAFMLTSGDWPRTRGFADGFFNPTYLPMVALRTAVAVGLAGLYALFAASFLKDADLKARVARWSATRWIVPAAVLVPLALLWYLSAAAGAGVAVAETLGREVGLARRRPRRASSGRRAPGTRSCAGPRAWRVGGTALLVVASLALVALRARRYGRLEAGLLMALGLVSMGGSEWVREGLRKPWVIDRHMFVNGVRVPRAGRGRRRDDPFALDALGPARGPRDLALGGGARRLPPGRPGLRADCRSPSGPRSRRRPAARSSGSSARPATPSGATSASGGSSGARASPRSPPSSTRRRGR